MGLRVEVKEDLARPLRPTWPRDESFAFQVSGFGLAAGLGIRRDARLEGSKGDEKRGAR